MKFFSINNKIYAKCAKCGRNYTVDVTDINEESEKKKHSKRISRRICFKHSKDGAVEINMPIEDTLQVEEYKKMNLELEQKLNAVLEENRILKERNFLLDQHFQAVVNKIPYGIFVCDNKMQIVFANDAFIELQGYKAKALANTHSQLSGVKITDVLCENAFSYLQSSLYSQDDNINKIITNGKRRFSLSTYSIKKGDFAFAIIKNIYKEEIAKEEISVRIQEVLDQNMAMIQKIGFLMGEETSKTTKTLNSIISTLKEEEE